MKFSIFVQEDTNSLTLKSMKEQIRNQGGKNLKFTKSVGFLTPNNSGEFDFKKTSGIITFEAPDNLKMEDFKFQTNLDETKEFKKT